MGPSMVSSIPFGQDQPPTKQLKTNTIKNNLIILSWINFMYVQMNISNPDVVKIFDHLIWLNQN